MKSAWKPLVDARLSAPTDNEGGDDNEPEVTNLVSSGDEEDSAEGVGIQIPAHIPARPGRISGASVGARIPAQPARNSGASGGSAAVQGSANDKGGKNWDVRKRQLEDDYKAQLDKLRKRLKKSKKESEDQMKELKTQLADSKKEMLDLEKARREAAEKRFEQRLQEVRADARERAAQQERSLLMQMLLGRDNSTLNSNLADVLKAVVGSGGAARLGNDENRLLQDRGSSD